MSIDSRIKQAILEAATEENQSVELVNKLIAWFEAIASGNEHQDDKERAFQHLEVIYQTAQVNEGEEAGS